MIKKSGADYAYIHVSFGPLAAFIRLWIECIIVRPCTGAIQSLSFSLYILKPFFPECDPPDEVTRLLAASCLCLLCFINCYSVKLSNMVTNKGVGQIVDIVLFRFKTISPMPRCLPFS